MEPLQGLHGALGSVVCGSSVIPPTAEFVAGGILLHYLKQCEGTADRERERERERHRETCLKK